MVINRGDGNAGGTGGCACAGQLQKFDRGQLDILTRLEISESKIKSIIALVGLDKFLMFHGNLFSNSILSY